MSLRNRTQGSGGDPGYGSDSVSSLDEDVYITGISGSPNSVKPGLVVV